MYLLRTGNRNPTVLHRNQVAVRKGATMSDGGTSRAKRRGTTGE